MNINILIFPVRHNAWNVAYSHNANSHGWNGTYASDKITTLHEKETWNRSSFITRNYIAPLQKTTDSEAFPE